METFSALLALCAGNSPVTGGFPSQRPVTRSFDVFFDLRLNKRLGKQSWGWWFQTPSRPLWRHCNIKPRPVQEEIFRNAKLSSYPGYFRKPHWLSMGLPEISRVTLSDMEKDKQEHKHQSRKTNITHYSLFVQQFVQANNKGNTLRGVVCLSWSSDSFTKFHEKLTALHGSLMVLNFLYDETNCTSYKSKWKGHLKKQKYRGKTNREAKRSIVND